ncbi:MAG: hypothetical protein EPO11_08950 [Gammaproteobacteria bacterium]|nr:MAG: hypothetical protein EPO11_08950 [Gammaproteobacteria bacterium]
MPYRKNAENFFNHYSNKKENFYEDTGLLKSIDDIKRRSTKGPINQVKGYRLYATEKPTNPHSLHDILRTDVNYIIALGNPDQQLPYFEKEETYIYFKNNEKVQVQVEPIIIHQTNGLPHYKLHCAFEYYNDNIIRHEEKTFTLIHLNNVDDEICDSFYQELSSIVDQGILVHCPDGKGQTGQVIATLLALMDKNIESLFGTDNIDTIGKNIYKFITQLRCSCPGLIVTPEQLFQFLKQAINCKPLEIKAKKVEEKIEEVDGFVMMREAREIEGEVQQPKPGYFSSFKMSIFSRTPKLNNILATFNPYTSKLSP